MDHHIERALFLLQGLPLRVCIHVSNRGDPSQLEGATMVVVGNKLLITHGRRLFAASKCSVASLWMSSCSGGLHLTDSLREVKTPQ